MINHTQQSRNRRGLPQPDKGQLQKPAANVTLNGQRLNGLHSSKIKNKTWIQ